MKNRVIFYSGVKDKELFHIQRFYYIDIELLKNLGYNVYESNKISDFLYFWEYDIAFIYFYKIGLFSAIIAKFFCKKVFFTGGIDNLDKKTTSFKSYCIQNIFFKLCYFFSDMCILVSISDQDNIKKIYNGKLPRRTYLSSHTIDVEKFLCNEMQQKQNIFTTIAWMQKKENVFRKGVDKAITIFKLLTTKEEYLDSKLYIIGKEGEGSEYLKELCKKMNISKKVIFTGSIEENLKINILKQSKYYLQLSSYEGFGIAALEALSAKNIVIHSGNGGLKDSIKDFGIKVDLKNDIEKQVESIYEQLVNFDLKKLEIAQKYVESNYSNNKRQIDFQKIIKY